MSTQRWTTQDRYLFRDGGSIALKVTAMSPDMIHEMPALRQRIADLLNATELSTDAVAMLQQTVMEAAAAERESRRAISSALQIDDTRIGTLDNLTDVFNHSERVLVVLSAEPSIKLDDPEMS